MCQQLQLQPSRCLHSSAAAGAADDSTKSSKGKWPTFGPSHQTLKALPFTVPRAAAAAAFTAYHGKHWYQSRQAPVLAKAFKEAFLPFWVASGKVQVEVRGAEVGHSHLVTRHDRRTGKAEPHWETVWSRVSVRLAWERQLQPEEPELQLYGSWKYNRRDIEALRPGPLLKQARPITPDMLQATPGSGITTRRVGPFTLDPHRARRLIMAAVEAQERKRAEEEIARLSGAQHVRFVDLHCTWWGSTGGAAGGSVGAAAARRGGLDLAPVYVPAFVFSWWHGGAKVRSFVSGVDVSQVAGVQVLDDTKLATITAATTASLGLLLGLSLPVLFWSGFVVPFVVAGFVSRFWPLLRSTAVNWWERWQEKRGRFSFNKEHQDFCEVDWNAAFVHAYERYEKRQQQNEQRQQFQQDHGWGSFAGRQADPFQAFQEMFRDPFSWFEKHYARQQQQFGGAQQQQQQQQAGRTSSGGSGGGARAAGAGGARAGPGSSRDPLGYYETLGVAPGCTMPEIQSAFRGLAMQTHPDRYTSAEDKARATKRFQAITEAYQVLRDAKKRQQYDAGQWRA